ncbi:MAG TPA: hypothetical protein VIU61_01345 [Kofleriaceae bacterium]
MTRASLAYLLLAGCWSTSQPETTKPVTATDVGVELAAVTLADDCGDQTPAAAPATPALVAPADSCDGPGCGSLRHECEQTSMQLAFKASGGEKSTQVRVKRVELLDAQGGVLGELKARGAKRWTNDHYVAWNQTLAPSEEVSATYSLASPDYEAFGGRWSAHEKTFQLRVTIEVGDRERVVEKQSITPAMLEPAVPT